MVLFKFLRVILPILLLAINGCSQKSQSEVYDEKNYSEERRGKIDNHYTVIFRNKDNSDYTINKIYSDSLFRDSSFIVFKYFFHKNLLDGPFELHSYGKLAQRGFYKNDKKQGEFVHYDSDGDIVRKEYYDIGKKDGIWEYYNSNHILYKKIYYDQNGKFAKKDLFNQRTGKFERTEYKEGDFD